MVFLSRVGGKVPCFHRPAVLLTFLIPEQLWWGDNFRTAAGCLYLLSIQFLRENYVSSESSEGQIKSSLALNEFQRRFLQFLMLPSHPSLKDKRCNEKCLVLGAAAAALLTGPQSQRGHKLPQRAWLPQELQHCQCHLTPCFFFQIINC